MVLLLDGVRYQLWTPTQEEDLAKQVKEHAKEIFGEDSIYFDLKQKLKSKAGIGSIPDGYVITFEKTPRWYILEIELSSHPLYEHVIPQVTKFMSGIENPKNRDEVVKAIYEEIAANRVTKAWVEGRIGSTENYKFLSDLISQAPLLVIVINEKTDELEEVSKKLPTETRVVEFMTFEREGIGLGVHAHLFEPIYEPSIEVGVRKPSVKAELPKALQEILDVVKLMDRGTPFSEATKIVAKQRNITEPTVRDKCTRQLKLNTEQFIEIVKDKPRLKSLLQERFPN